MSLCSIDTSAVYLSTYVLTYSVLTITAYFWDEMYVSPCLSESHHLAILVESRTCQSSPALRSFPGVQREWPRGLSFRSEWGQAG